MAKCFITTCLLLGAITFAFAKSTSKEIVYGRHANRSSNVTCDVAYKTCRNIPKCAQALKKIKKRCHTLTNCTSEKDMMTCKNKSDNLFHFAFPEKPCLCTKFNRKCRDRYNLVYANQCFYRIDAFLYRKREAELHREREAQLQKEREELHSDNQVVTEITESQSAAAQLQSVFMPDSDSQDVEKEIVEEEIEEVVFGDEGFQKPPSRRRPTLQLYKAHLEVIRTTKKLTTALVQTTTPKLLVTDGTTTIISQLDILRDKILGEQSKITTDMKYRIVSIVIGSLFLFVVFAGVICLAARRMYRSSMLYKRGKIIDQQQKRDGSALS